MVLVSQPCRRRGLATRLLQAAVDCLLRAGLVPMLDATPEGRAVYSRLGFVGIEDIDRWRGEVAGDGTEGPGRSDFGQLASIDLSAFGADRLHLLAALGSRPGSSVFVDDGGYAIVRRGRLASQIGPVVAPTVEGGRDLVRAILDRARGAIIADVPRSATEAARPDRSRLHGAAKLPQNGVWPATRCRSSSPRGRSWGNPHCACGCCSLARDGGRGIRATSWSSGRRCRRSPRGTAAR
jgi:hypothetical protein